MQPRCNRSGLRTGPPGEREIACRRRIVNDDLRVLADRMLHGEAGGGSDAQQPMDVPSSSSGGATRTYGEDDRRDRERIATQVRRNSVPSASATTANNAATTTSPGGRRCAARNRCGPSPDAAVAPLARHHSVPGRCAMPASLLVGHVLAPAHAYRPQCAERVSHQRRRERRARVCSSPAEPQDGLGARRWREDALLSPRGAPRQGWPRCSDGVRSA